VWTAICAIRAPGRDLFVAHLLRREHGRFRRYAERERLPVESASRPAAPANAASETASASHRSARWPRPGSSASYCDATTGEPVTCAANADMRLVETARTACGTGDADASARARTVCAAASRSVRSDLLHATSGEPSPAPNADGSRRVDRAAAARARAASRAEPARRVHPCAGRPSVRDLRRDEREPSLARRTLMASFESARMTVIPARAVRAIERLVRRSARCDDVPEPSYRDTTADAGHVQCRTPTAVRRVGLHRAEMTQSCDATTVTCRSDSSEAADRLLTGSGTVSGTPRPADASMAVRELLRAMGYRAPSRSRASGTLILGAWRSGSSAREPRRATRPLRPRRRRPDIAVRPAFSTSSGTTATETVDFIGSQTIAAIYDPSPRPSLTPRTTRSRSRARRPCAARRPAGREAATTATPLRTTARRRTVDRDQDMNDHIHLLARKSRTRRATAPSSLTSVRGRTCARAAHARPVRAANERGRSHYWVEIPGRATSPSPAR
jgi:hypothetical protein